MATTPIAEEVVRDFVDRLARMEEKIDGLREDKTDHSVRLTRHSARLDRLERALWIAMGAATVSTVPEIVRLASAVPSAGL